MTNRRTEEGHTLIIYYKDRQQKHKNWKGKTDRKDGKTARGKGAKEKNKRE